MKLIPAPALRIVSCFILFCALTVTASAQLESMAPKAPWLRYFFLKLSPNTPEFSATGQFDMFDSSGQARFELPMDIVASRTSFRWESDISQIWPMPPEVKSMAEQLRTDKMVFLVKMEQHAVYMLYPNLQAYVQIPIPAWSLAYFDAKSSMIQLQKTDLGSETFDGHPCIKNSIADVEPNVPSQPGLVWSASDLQGFPIKIVLETDRGIMRFQFRNVVLQNPAPSLFEIPTNYMLFTNTVALMNYAKRQVSQ